MRTISILLLTRKRPEGLKRVLESLRATTTHPEALEVIVSIDEDDEDTAKVLAGGKSPFRVVGAKAPRADAVTQTYNVQYAQSSGDIIAICPDDVVFAIPGWDDITRDTFRRDLIGPTSLGVAYPADEQVGFGFATAPHLSRQMIRYHERELGFYMPPWFPFWFADTWWDEIGRMMACHVMMPWGVSTPDGKGLTRGMRDLPFWADVFDATRILRMRVVRKLIDAAYWDRPGLRSTLQAQLEERALFLRYQTTQYREPEKVAALHAQGEETEPTERYLRAKARAERLLNEIT